jgi:hypothetical protein
MGVCMHNSDSDRRSITITKFTRTKSIAAMSLFVGTVMPAWAQHVEEKGKPAQAQGRQEKSVPQQQHAQAPKEQQHAQAPKQQEHAQAPRQQHAQAPTQQARQQPQRSQQQAQSWQHQEGWAQKGGWQAHAPFQQNRSQNWSSDHRTWAQRGCYGGYYIPQDRFSVSFGSQHCFRIGMMPSMYMGYPRFFYGGSPTADVRSSWSIHGPGTGPKTGIPMTTFTSTMTTMTAATIYTIGVILNIGSRSR